MNTENEKLIEDLLRRCPQPRPPLKLKDDLLQRAKSAKPGSTPRRSITARVRYGWLRRWWPALAPTAISLACVVVFAAQQIQIRELRQDVATLSAAAAPLTPAPTQPAPGSVDSAKPESQEIARLKSLADRLSAEVSQLEKLRVENQRLRSLLAAPAGGVTPEEAAEVQQAREEVEKARDRAEAIQCVNNLKQLGLAVRLWSLDNGNVFPPDILSMTNEMGTPKILVCPADSSRQPAVDWASYTAANCSYQYLAPGATDMEPNRVLFLCPIHGTICLCDGSVQLGIAKEHPDRLVRRNGKLYFQPKSSPSP